MTYLSLSTLGYVQSNQGAAEYQQFTVIMGLLGTSWRPHLGGSKMSSHPLKPRRLLILRYGVDRCFDSVLLPGQFDRSVPLRKGFTEKTSCPLCSRPTND